VPKTITIDSAVILQIRVIPGTNGKVAVQCEYQLRSGTVPIQSFNEDVTRLLGSSEQVAASSILDAVARAIGADQGVAATTVWS